MPKIPGLVERLRCWSDTDPSQTASTAASSLRASPEPFDDAEDNAICALQDDLLKRGLVCEASDAEADGASALPGEAMDHGPQRLFWQALRQVASNRRMCTVAAETFPVDVTSAPSSEVQQDSTGGDSSSARSDDRHRRGSGIEEVHHPHSAHLVPVAPSAPPPARGGCRPRPRRSGVVCSEDASEVVTTPDDHFLDPAIGRAHFMQALRHVRTESASKYGRPSRTP